MDLRPYQNDSIELLRSEFKENKRKVILQIPTGGGKTIIFSKMAQQIIKNGKRVLIICDRKELIKQAKEKLNSFGLFPTLIIPKNKIIDNFIYLGSVDTLRRREFPKIDVLIVDEAHKQTFDPIILKYLEINPDLFIIGATATPIRVGSQKSMHFIYDSIVSPVQIKNLINDSFLVNCRTFSAKEDFSKLSINKGDFDISQMYAKFNEAGLYDGMLKNYLKFASGLKTIIFNVNVEHSKNVTRQFNEAGISAVHLDGNTPDGLRSKILEDFKNGVYTVLSNCSVLTTGFDEPSIQAVIINRATTSLSLYLQMCGRGSRIFKNKKDFIIIDQGANVWRFGLWNEDREFSLFKKEKTKIGAQPVKICPSCEEINPASARVCKTCGHFFEVKKKKLKESEFIEVTKVQKHNRKNLYDSGKVGTIGN